MKPQAYRPTPVWVAVLGLAAYALVAAIAVALIWLAWALLLSLAVYQ